jgi:hypothetical protein
MMFLDISAMPLQLQINGSTDLFTELEIYYKYSENVCESIRTYVNRHICIKVVFQPPVELHSLYVFVSVFRATPKF